MYTYCASRAGRGAVRYTAAPHRPRVSRPMVATRVRRSPALDATSVLALALTTLSLTVLVWDATTEGLEAEAQAGPSRVAQRPARGVPSSLPRAATLERRWPVFTPAASKGKGADGGGRRAARRAPPTGVFVVDPRKVEVLALGRPRAFIYRGLLTDEECDFLITHSTPNLHKSGVINAETGGSLLSDIRTSSGSFVPKGYNELVKEVERKIAAFSMVPEENGEAIQVLQYKNGEEYKAHYDYFFHKGGMNNNRVATALMYLSEVEEGGETAFPQVPLEDGGVARGGQWSDCAKGVLAVKPRKGDVLLFWSMKAGGELDGGSSHASCPVISGTKWTATKWMHVGSLAGRANSQVVWGTPKPEPTPTCSDSHETCASWAEQGECSKNPGFMHDSCKLSCEICEGVWPKEATETS